MTAQELQQLRGAEVVSETGETIGELSEVYCDAETEAPEWIVVPSGVFTTKRHLVPASHVEPREDTLVVPFSADQVKDAPPIVEDELDEETERALYDHYGLDYGERAARRRGPAKVWFRSAAEQPLLGRSD